MDMTPTAAVTILALIAALPALAERDEMKYGWGATAEQTRKSLGAISSLPTACSRTNITDKRRCQAVTINPAGQRFRPTATLSASLSSSDSASNFLSLAFSVDSALSRFTSDGSS